ncbi:MAG: N-acetyltransferase [Burkholderiales bacterium]|nr:N-acetyltransferase [Burkholderiales bacterium]
MVANYRTPPAPAPSPSLSTLTVLDSLRDLDPAEWDALGGGHPLVSHAFLHALHETGCAVEDTGWTPQYLVLTEGGALAGAMPLYVKMHSYGEYVFDWAWADAYRRHGLAYYPKLLSAIPFTPCTTPRLLGRGNAVRAALLNAALELAGSAEVSSLHVNFPAHDDEATLRRGGMLQRHTVQFHWQNRGYADFEAFLATMSHDKRKKIRQERRKVREAGIRFRRVAGEAIDQDLWRFWMRCYAHTYRAHHSTPYLNLAFFERIGRTMPQHLLLVVGSMGGSDVCASLCIHDGATLYGRYWGALGYAPGLHFETCYYQPLEFCIERGIGTFEGGAQGEHKLARGFLPVETRSFHWLKHPQFADAVEDFLKRESAGIHRYVNELQEHAPFKQPSAAGAD